MPLALILLTVDALNFVRLIEFIGLFPRTGFAFSCFFYFSKDYLIALKPDLLLI